MGESLSCDSVSELVSLAKEVAGEEEVVQAVSVVLAAAREGIGRVAISRMLSLRERLVRRAMEGLRRRRLPGLASALRIDARAVGGSVVAVYGPADEGVLRALESSVVKLRDYLVISSGDPAKVEVIGVWRGRAVFPGVPEEYAKRYEEALGSLGINAPSIAVFWKRYDRYLDDARLLFALFRLCSEGLAGAGEQRHGQGAVPGPQ